MYEYKALYFCTNTLLIHTAKMLTQAFLELLEIKAIYYKIEIELKPLAMTNDNSHDLSLIVLAYLLSFNSGVKSPILCVSLILELSDF